MLRFGRLAKLGEDVTETLEVVPAPWKVIQTAREKFTCRECEEITRPPAPFDVTPRGFAGPNFLAMILFEKFAQRQPLDRQSERYARDDIDFSLSMLADQIGACTAALRQGRKQRCCTPSLSYPSFVLTGLGLSGHPR